MNATIDGIEVFLKENPAFSYSFYDFIDPNKVKGDTSTTIEVAATLGAEQALGGRPMNERARKREHVLDVGPGYWRGTVRVAEWREDSIALESVAGNGGWITAAKEQRLRQLNMGFSPLVTPEYQRQTWTDQEDPVYFPLIDYGSFEGQPNTFNVLPIKLRPAIRVWKVLETFFANNGFSLNVTGKLQGLWKKLVMPNTSEDIQSVGCSVASDAASITGTLLPQLYTAPAQNSTPPPVPFGVVIQDPGGNFPGLGATYVMPISAGQRVRVSLCRMLIVWDPFSDTGRTVNMVLWSQQAGLLDSVSVPLTADTGQVTFSHVYGEREVPQGDTLYIGIQSADGDPIQLSVLGGETTVTYDPTPPPFQGYTIDEPLVIASLNPDWTAAELIASLTSLLSLAWRTDDASGVVTVAHFDDTLRPTSEGRDWRGREYETEGVKINPAIPSAYWFRYTHDNKDRLLVEYQSRIQDPGYGNANREIEGGVENPLTIDVDFAPTGMGTIFGGLFVPVMRKHDGDAGVDVYDYTPRILIADTPVAGVWRHAAVNQTVVPKCYFVYPGELRYGMDFGGARPGVGVLGGLGFSLYGQVSPGLVEQHYRERNQRLATSYILSIPLRIDDDELVSMDFSRPVYVDDGYGGGWYYILLVDQKQFGTEGYTRCSLLQA